VSWARATEAGVELLVLVQPRASRTRLVGEHDGRVKIALAAPPVDGEANAALLDFIAELLSLRRVDVRLLDGASSRRKRLLVQGVALDRARTLMSAP
jgi:uncharacterized protein (TIGR00251 family)